jgi:hypothetical protein
MWKVSIFKVVASACVSYGLMGWPPRASFECADHMVEIWAQ